jgi:hypothetical protein
MAVISSATLCYKLTTAFCYMRIYIHAYIVHTYTHTYVHTVLYAQFTLSTKHTYSYAQTPLFNSARSDIVLHNDLCYSSICITTVTTILLMIFGRCRKWRNVTTNFTFTCSVMFSERQHRIHVARRCAETTAILTQIQNSWIFYVLELSIYSS